MKMKNLSELGILALVVSIVIISGCTNTSTNTSTSQGNIAFTDGNMTFNYPADFQTANQSGDPIISGGNGWQTVKILGNNQGISIHIQKFQGSQTPAQSIIANQISVKSNSGSVLSTTNQSNPNGVEINGDIHTLTRPTDNTLVRYYDMSFVANGKTYFISVLGNDKDNSNILEVKNMIYNSLNVS